MATNNSEHIFGCGRGHLSERVRRAVKRAGGTLVNSYHAQCNCGYRCRPYTCEQSARHWLTCPELGNGTARLEADILEAVEAALTKADRKVLGR